MQLYDGPSIKGPANNTNYSPSVNEISSVQKCMFINVYFFLHVHIETFINIINLYLTFVLIAINANDR